MSKVKIDVKVYEEIKGTLQEISDTIADLMWVQLQDPEDIEWVDGIPYKVTYI